MEPQGNNVERHALPTVHEVLASLPEAFRSGLVMTVEPQDPWRSRLSLTVDAGSAVDTALFGAQDWTRLPTAARPFHTMTPQHRRSLPQTYWRYVLPDDHALNWPGPLGEQTTDAVEVPFSR